MHPCSFEKSPVVVAAQDGFAFRIHYADLLYGFGEAQHVVAHQRNPRTDSRCVVLLKVGLRTIRTGVFARTPSLQLSAPDATIIHVEFPVVVLEYGRVDAVASLDGFGLCLERAGGRGA